MLCESKKKALHREDHARLTRGKQFEINRRVEFCGALIDWVSYDRDGAVLGGKASAAVKHMVYQRYAEPRR
ncbi:MAG TPA: hypothetical protein VME66_11495 [Candidatus Acidoferrales bacterium]|nr:hypothetical protein [Candidatus Acidoferrales bacterium]